MNCTSPHESSDELRSLRVRLGEIRRLESALAAEKLGIVRRIEALATAHRGPVVAERELVAHAGLTPREARDVVARAEVVELVPELGDALARASTTTAHLDVLARAMRTASEAHEAFAAHLPHLVRSASSMRVSDFASLCKEAARSVLTDDGIAIFERQRKSTYLRGSFDDEGCLKLSGYFDPERGAALWSIIDQRRERLFHSADESPVDVMPWVEPNEHRNALALLDAIRPTTSASAGDSQASHVFGRAEVVVHVDLRTLKDGSHSSSTARTSFGGRLPVATIRRLACEAEIIPVVLNGHGVPLDVGRTRRLATVGQRRALEAIHTTCAITDCATPFHHCQIHHIDYWESGGSTDLANMIPLCSRHHHAVHEGGWHLTLDPVDRKLTVTHAVREPTDDSGPPAHRPSPKSHHRLPADRSERIEYGRSTPPVRAPARPERAP